MPQLSLLVALAGLAFVPAPQDPAPQPAPAPAPAQGGGKDDYGGVVGTQDPRWMARIETRKVLFESGGKSLMDAWQGAWIWLNGQTPEQDALMPAEDGRGVGLSALCALSMSGNGSGIRSGAQKLQFRVLTRALRNLQDAESGSYVAEDAPERALDQALAVHCIAEAAISHPVEALQEHNRKGVAALLALRGQDGLWHVGPAPKPDEPPAARAVDAYTTGLATYALYTAKDGGAEIEAEVFESIASWSDTAKIGGADEGARAADAVGILTARIWSHAALERKLDGDARTQELLKSIDAWLPEPPSDGKPAGTARVERNDFVYLASVALYQADNLRWNRLYTWIRDRAVADLGGDTSGARGCPAAPNGRLPSGAVATTALRILQMQSAVREPALP
jgi:hypothetical protein